MAGMTLEDVTACMELFQAAKAVTDEIARQRFGPVTVAWDKAARLVQAVEATQETCDW